MPKPPLGREQLLLAALHAASDFAAGTPDPSLQQDLADKKFEFRIRFGCGGPGQGGKQPFDWSFNSGTRALKVRATPELSPKDPPVREIAGEAFEAVEGFWIRRPWLLESACPKTGSGDSKAKDNPADAKAPAAKPKKPETPASDVPSAPSPPDHSVGIAQFFTATGPRTMRRSGRAYEATKKLEEDKAPEGGFDLVIQGRLVSLPDGRVIACTRSSGGDRPDCVIFVEFGTVSIERADTHEQLAQWGAG